MPTPARVGDPTSDEGAVTRGCETVMIRGTAVARENDEVDTPELGKGSIVEHAKTVQAGGRFVALTGNRCAPGGPGDAGNGVPDVLSMSSTELLIARLNEDRARLDRGEQLPKQQMSASPEPPARPELPDAIEVEQEIGRVDLPDGSRATLTGRFESGLTDSGAARATATAGRAGLDLDVQNASGPDFGASVDVSGPTLSGGVSGDVGNLESGGRGVEFGGGFGATLFGIGFGGRLEVSALDALSSPGGIPNPVLRSYLGRTFPSLDDYTASVEVDKAGVQVGNEVGGDARLAVEDGRVEAEVSGDLAVFNLDGVGFGVGRRKGTAPAKKEASDVVVLPADNTVLIEHQILSPRD